MKTFNPIVISVNKFSKFFSICATHFDIDPSEYHEKKDFIFVQMPKAKTIIHGVSKTIQSDGSDIHQLELHRVIQGMNEHLFTFVAVNIVHPQPCIVLDAVNYDDQQFDLTALDNNELQEAHYLRALRHSLFFKKAGNILGKKPEEMRHVSEEARQWMTWLSLPYTSLREKIEETALPPDYPKKGEVILKEIPNALNLESLVETSDIANYSADVTPLRPEERIGTTEKGPNSAQVISFDRFKKQL